MTPHENERRRGWPAVLVFLVIVGAAAASVRLTAGRRPNSAGGHGSGGPTGAETSAPGHSPSASASTLGRMPWPIPGYLLIADRGNNRMILVDSHRRILWTYPAPGTIPTVPFRFDDDAFFGPSWGAIISNQEEQHTVQIISFPGGRMLWMYGHVDRPGSAPGFLNTPDDAYLLRDGTVEVADVSNCRVLFINRDKQIIRQIGTTGRCGHDPPRLINLPNGDTPLPDGGTIVTEITGSWVDGIGPTGEMLWAFRAPIRYPSDAQWLGDDKILVADYSNPGHVLVMTTKGKVLWSYGPATGSGKLNHPSLALMLPNGLIAVNDDYQHRVVIISQTKNRIVWQYGHLNRPGLAMGYLDTPDGMDFLPLDVAMSIPAIRAVVQP